MAGKVWEIMILAVLDREPYRSHRSHTWTKAHRELPASLAPASECMRSHTHAYLHESEPDEEKFPPPGMADAWLDSGFSVAASAGFQSSAAAVRTVARIAIMEALKDLSLQDALDVLAEAARETVESSHI